MKKCTKCNEEKSFDNFYKQKSYKDGYQGHCKSCINEKAKQYYQENKENLNELYKEYRKKYRKDNKEKLSKKNVQYNKQRRQIDPIFKFKGVVRANIKGAFKRGTKKFRKNTKTEQILGCTIEEFRLYIQSKFTKGMTIENHGEWHLDHIYPISLAKSEDEIIKLNHYTNFQPLWAEENLSKSNKIVNNDFIHLTNESKAFYFS